MMSLRRRMIFTLFAGLVLGGVGGAMGLYLQAIEELNELFDDRLRTIGDSLEPETLARDAPARAEEEEDDIVVQLWTRDGRMLFHTRTDELAPMPTGPGFSDLKAASEAWRSYARQTADGRLLQVAQEVEARREEAAESVFHLLLPLLVMLPLLAVFTAWAVARQLRPLQILAEQLHTRGAMIRSAVVVPDAPLELVPVVEALNELLARQADASRKQQAFLADAAHELRTPLAVVSVQARRAQQAVGERDRVEALDALHNGVDRATRLVSQLLALARSESGATESRSPAAVDLEALVKTVLAELFPLAGQKQIDLGLAETAPCVVVGDPEMLRSLISNLVDNAIRFTPTGGQVDVALRVAGKSATLLVSDTGPGIPIERRPQVFERFERGGAADIHGTGLGLAIARQVAEHHGGSIALEDGESGRGLRVCVSLPLAG